MISVIALVLHWYYKLLYMKPKSWPTKCLHHRNCSKKQTAGVKCAEIWYPMIRYTITEICNYKLYIQNLKKKKKKKKSDPDVI